MKGYGWQQWRILSWPGFWLRWPDESAIREVEVMSVADALSCSSGSSSKEEPGDEQQEPTGGGDKFSVSRQLSMRLELCFFSHCFNASPDVSPFSHCCSTCCS